MWIYDCLGGQDAIIKVVDVFYEKVLADETVNQFFKETDMENSGATSPYSSAGHWEDLTSIPEEAWSSRTKA